jgi:hypothetical protein
MATSVNTQFLDKELDKFEMALQHMGDTHQPTKRNRTRNKTDLEQTLLIEEFENSGCQFQ